MEVELAAYLGLVLGVVNLCALPVIIGKVFFSTHSQVLVTPSEHQQIRQDLGMEPLPLDEEPQLGPDIEGIERYLDAAETRKLSERLTRQIFPQGEPDEEVLT